MARKCPPKTGSCKFAALKTKARPLCGPFVLDGSDGPLFDHFAQEHTAASGTEILYWHQDLETSLRDPLYDEPIDRVWRGPFKLKGFVEYMEGQPQMSENGMTVRWQGRIFIARLELEQSNAPAPLEGDVLKFWENKFFQEHSVNGDESIPNAGYYFDVINADDVGHVHDSDRFVGFNLTVQRRTEFTAERRLDS